MAYKLKYPPKVSPEFKKLWKKYFTKIVERENFHEGHLDQLKIFVDLLLEYEGLSIFVKENGYTYKTDGRYGESYKPYPEVALRQNTVKEIRAYAKQLDIVLTKDTSTTEPDQDEWK